MNRTVAGVVLLAHGLAFAALVATHTMRPEQPVSSSPLAVRLIDTSGAARAALVPNQSLRHPVLFMPASPAQVPPPSFVEAAPAEIAAQVPAVVVASASFTAVRAEPTPAPESEREVAVALPADHGSCSARGVARHYPAILRERGIEGQVLLKVRVDPEGRASDVLVQNGSGWRLLDEAARQVALSCPYLPARRGEQRLTAWVEYPVRFALGRAP